MDYTGLPIFNIMKNKLNYHSARQSVLAQNIANADTPNYKAQDVAAPNFRKMLSEHHRPPAHSSHSAGHLQSPSSMAVTKPGHISGMGIKKAAFASDERKETFELNPNGNNVSIEEEMAEVAKNQGEYTKVLNLYSKTISLFKTAIGNPSGGG